MPVKLYSWDDAGAPQLSTANDGSVLSILRACLVDGYGTRTAAGWTMPFSDLVNNKGVLKPANGDDVHVQIDDNYNYAWGKVKGFGAMTGVDTGVDEFPVLDELHSGLVAGTFTAFSKATSTSVEDLRWWVIVDDGFFYYMAHDTNYPSGFFYGKMNHLNPNHPNPYVLTYGLTTNTFTGSSSDDSLFSPNPDGIAIMNGYLNVNKNERLFYKYDTTNYANPNPIDGKLIIQRIKLSTETSPYVYVGELPNWNRCLGAEINNSEFVTGGKLVFNGIKYLSFSKSNVAWLFDYDVDAG